MFVLLLAWLYTLNVIQPGLIRTDCK
jgi:hypothetical protein